MRLCRREQTVLSEVVRMLYWLILLFHNTACEDHEILFFPQRLRVCYTVQALILQIFTVPLISSQSLLQPVRESTLSKTNACTHTYTHTHWYLTAFYHTLYLPSVYPHLCVCV